MADGEFDMETLAIRGIKIGLEITLKSLLAIWHKIAFVNYI